MTSPQGANEPLCICKDRAASACPGEWEPGCDLGNNAAHARVHHQTPEERAAMDSALGLWVCPSMWPSGWNFKPTEPRRMLVKAGALILAEIERLDRAAGITQPHGEAG